MIGSIELVVSEPPQGKGLLVGALCGIDQVHVRVVGIKEGVVPFCLIGIHGQIGGDTSIIEIGFVSQVWEEMIGNVKWAAGLKDWAGITERTKANIIKKTVRKTFFILSPSFLCCLTES